MAVHDCPTCTCGKEPPTYPVTCPHCGITYGPGGEVDNHREQSEGCRNRAQARGTKSVRPPGGEP